MGKFFLFCTGFILSFFHANLTADEIALNTAYHVDTVWATAYQITVSLTNPTSQPTQSWQATFTIPAPNVLSTHISGGQFSVNGQNVTVTNLSSNGSIAAQGKVTFSMIINMPRSGQTTIGQLAGIATIQGSNPSGPNLSTPVLSVTVNGDTKDYTLSWASVANATSYVLEEDTDSTFSTPQIVVQGNVLSCSFTNKPTGQYFYRLYASNSLGNSDFSNVVNVTVTDDTPIPPRDTIEFSDWYIDWTSWFTGPAYVIPQDATTLNIFVGELVYGSDGKPTMDGFGTFTLPQLKAFVQYLGQQSPPIKAKVSIGGGGGSYDRTWDILNSSNIQAFAQGMADFCHQNGLAGVDFDYEAFESAAQESLVGSLIKAFKLIDPNLETSLCSNAGFGPNFPWQADMKNILDAAMISPGNCAVDRFYIMSYYDPMSSEIEWIVGSDGQGGWTNWLEANYGFSRARISVGIDDFDAHAYDPAQFRSWALAEGFSVAHWAFDPAHRN